MFQQKLSLCGDAVGNWSVEVTDINPHTNKFPAFSDFCLATRWNGLMNGLLSREDFICVCVLARFLRPEIYRHGVRGGWYIAVVFG